MKKVVIIGSTGSIGRQAVEVIKNHKAEFSCIGLVAEKSQEIFTQQRLLKAKYCGLFLGEQKNCIHGKECYEIAGLKEADIVVIAASGIAALPYLVKAIEKGKVIALANKECIVSLGKILLPLAKKHNAKILPVDSEHSAIWQCLMAGERKDVEKILLTASGGPFFNCSLKELKTKTVKDALNHPTWSMGRKITIDSATMANKGLEVIEACRLFDITEDKIKVVVQRESVIHSMVEYKDGAIIAEMSNPTMEIPIQLALTYPNREITKAAKSGIDFAKIRTLTFYDLDDKKFPFVKLCRQAENMGGAYPLILSAANEVAVERFLNNEIGFTKIYEIVKKTIDKINIKEKPTLNNASEMVEEVKKLAQKIK